MGQKILNKKGCSDKEKAKSTCTSREDKTFVLSDVTKKELKKRRISAYSYIL